MGLIFSYRESRSILHKARPLLKLLLLLGFAFCPWYICLPIMMILAILVRLPILSYLRHSVFLIILALLIWYSNGYPTALSFVSVILSGMLFADSTDPEDLAQSLRPLLGESFSLGLSVTLWMLPVVIESTQTTSMARSARGERFIGRDYLDSILTRLLEKAQEFTLAYRSRN